MKELTLPDFDEIRSRFVRDVGSVGMAIGFVLMIFRLGQGQIALGVVSGIFGILCGCTLYYRKKRPVFASHLIIGCCFFITTTAQILTASQLSAPIFASIVVCTVAFLLVELKWSLLWSALVVIRLIAVMSVFHFGVVFIEPPPQSFIVNSQFFTVPLLIMIVCYIVYQYRGMMELLLKRLSDSQKELTIAREQAEKALKVRSEFLANMSHEIRTPLNGILGLTELLKDDLKEPNQVDTAKKILSSSDLLLTIIDDILDFSKLEAGKIQIYPIRSDSKEVLSKAVELFEPLAQKKQIKLTQTIHESVPKQLLFDEYRVRQVISNLVSNGVKFIEKGKVAVEMSFSKENSKCFLTIVVSDTGPGISEENQSKLFQSFTQSDQSTTRRHGGTGLGLSISKSIVGLMGGKISLESQLGQGSRFSVKFPVEEVDAEELEIKSSPSSFSLPRKVLVAEDNKINQLVIGGMLERMGVEFEIVEDGQKVIEKLRLHSQNYDLILMDCHMPIMDGFEASRKIREQFGDDIPILACTASVMDDDINRCLAAGMNDIISKPLFVQNLETKLAAFSHRWKHSG